MISYYDIISWHHNMISYYDLILWYHIMITYHDIIIQAASQHPPPCLSRRACFKNVLLHVYVWMDGWVDARMYERRWNYVCTSITLHVPTYLPHPCLCESYRSKVLRTSTAGSSWCHCNGMPRLLTKVWKRRKPWKMRFQKWGKTTKLGPGLALGDLGAVLGVLGEIF